RRAVRVDDLDLAERHVRRRQNAKPNVAVDTDRRADRVRRLLFDLAAKLVPVDQVRSDQSGEQKRDDDPRDIGQDRIQDCLPPHPARERSVTPGGFIPAAFGLSSRDERRPDRQMRSYCGQTMDSDDGNIVKISTFRKKARDTAKSEKAAQAAAN